MERFLQKTSGDETSRSYDTTNTIFTNNRLVLSSILTTQGAYQERLLETQHGIITFVPKSFRLKTFAIPDIPECLSLPLLF